MVARLENITTRAGTWLGREVFASIFANGCVREYGSGEAGCEGGAIASGRYNGAAFRAGAGVAYASGEEFGATTRHLGPVLHDSFGDEDTGVRVRDAGDGWV